MKRWLLAIREVVTLYTAFSELGELQIGFLECSICKVYQTVNLQSNPGQSHGKQSRNFVAACCMHDDSTCRLPSILFR